MALKQETIMKTISREIQDLGYTYMKELVSGVPVVFGKRVCEDMYLFLLVGRERIGNNCLSIEMSISLSTNAFMLGRDIPSASIRRLDVILKEESNRFFVERDTGLFMSEEKVSNTTSLSNSVAIAETDILRDSRMIESLRKSKKLLVESQLEKWVICYYNKDISQLPFREFLNYTPSKPVDDIPMKWFFASDVVHFLIPWNRQEKDSVYYLALQSYWKDYLDSQPMFYPENKDL